MLPVAFDLNPAILRTAIDLSTMRGDECPTTFMKKYMCLICGWIYDEAAGAPEDGLAPGTRWEDVPINWTCPECGARKDDFEMVEI